MAPYGNPISVLCNSSFGNPIGVFLNSSCCNPIWVLWALICQRSVKYDRIVRMYIGLCATIGLWHILKSSSRICVLMLIAAHIGTQCGSSRISSWTAMEANRSSLIVEECLYARSLFLSLQSRHQSLLQATILTR